MATIGKLLWLILVITITNLWFGWVLFLSTWQFVHVGIREWNLEAGRAAWQGKLVEHFQAYLLGIELVNAYAEGMKGDE